MKNLKKVVSLLAVAMLVFALTACSSSSSSTSESSQTINGITRTERTITENGKTTTEVEYKDADGNILSEADGEAAFEEAKNASSEN